MNVKINEFNVNKFLFIFDLLLNDSIVNFFNSNP